MILPSVEVKCDNEKCFVHESLSVDIRLVDSVGYLEAARQAVAREGWGTEYTLAGSQIKRAVHYCPDCFKSQLGSK